MVKVEVYNCNKVCIHHQTPSRTASGGPIIMLLSSPSTTAWTLSNANGSIRVPGSVPAVVHTLLLAAGTLKGDPLFRYNEQEWSWVAREEWTLEGRFEADAGLVGGNSVLRLEGVDTVADISLNGQPIGHLDDAFIAWQLPVAAGLLRASGNVLTVRFTPPLEEARARAEAYPTQVPSSVYFHDWAEDCDPYPLYPSRDCHNTTRRNFLRKPPYDFGWDWGPAFLPTGILGNVSLTSSAPDAPWARLADARVVQRWHSPGPGVTIEVTGVAQATPSARPSSSPSSSASSSASASAWAAYAPTAAPVCGVETGYRSTVPILAELCFPSCSQVGAERHAARSTVSAHAADGSAAGCGATAAHIHLPVPRLWWPRGHGDHPLYELRVTACDAHQVNAHSQPTDMDVLRPSAAKNQEEPPGEATGSKAASIAAAYEECAPRADRVTVVRWIGLRRVELVQDFAPPPYPDAPAGTTFYFRINGEPIFVKGANMIPASVFEDTVGACASCSGDAPCVACANGSCPYTRTCTCARAVSCTSLLA